LLFAVEDAYRGMLMVGRHPVAILNVALPPEEVDVNVHPTKADVRFRDEGAVFAAVQKAVRATIVEASPVSSGTGSAFVPRPDLELTSNPWTPPLWEAGLRLEEADPSRLPAATALEERPSTPAEALPVLRVIGQFGNIYIITEGPEGMYLIDQHAAHERVLYEQFAAARLHETPRVQGLLDPLTIDLPPRERNAIAQESGALAEHGFDIDSFGDSAVVIRALPSSLASGDVRENVARFLEHLLDEERDDHRDRVAMSLACHGAIRAGKALAADEMRDLIRQLELTEAPNTCPHGRPTMVHVSADMLAKGFGRR
jgi:DNA mismatch repair protein MutL